MDTYEWIHMSFAAKVANVVLVAKVVQISIDATGKPCSTFRLNNNNN